MKCHVIPCTEVPLAGKNYCARHDIEGRDIMRYYKDGMQIETEEQGSTKCRYC